MARRKRKHIPLSEQLAAALACLLESDVRTVMRRHQTPAKSVIRLFTMDHIALHAFGGSDKWWNLDPRVRGPELKAKDAKDTGRAAKVVRIRANPLRPGIKVITRPKPKRASRWGSRPLRSQNNLRKRSK